jgi:hypothetical protein
MATQGGVRGFFGRSVRRAGATPGVGKRPVALTVCLLLVLLIAPLPADAAKQAKPSLSIDDVSVSEGDAATLTITMSASSSKAVTVKYSTSTGTASKSDFTKTSGTASIAAGSLTTTVSVPTVQDSMVEGAEAFTVNLSNASGATVADSSGTVSILDDDGVVTPSISISDATVVEGAAASVSVDLSATTSKTVTVQYATSDETADSSDYTSTTGTATIQAGDLSTTIAVQTTEDQQIEPGETFVITLSDPTNASISGGSGTVTITDDDVPAVSVGDASTNEGGVASFDVSLSEPFTRDVSIQWTTVEGVASSDDFVVASGTATIVSGQTSTTVDVTTVEDTAVEPDESFTVELSNPINATLDDSVGKGTIVDDDDPSLAIDDVSVNEGAQATLKISLSERHSKDVTVDWTTLVGTATSDDFTAASGTATIPAGDLSTTVSVDTLQDARIEDTEVFTVELSNATRSTISDESAKVSVLDDDAPSILVEDADVAEGEDAVVTVSLSEAHRKDVTFAWTTVEGSATADDYTGGTDTVTIPAGATSVDLTFPTVGDSAIEGDEVFTVEITDVTNATTADGSATVTITDDDLPTLSVDDSSVDEGASTTVEVTLSEAFGSDVSVDWTLNPGTATEDDFVQASGTTIIPAGTTSALIPVTTSEDGAIEPDEMFTVELSNPTSATIADGTGRITVVDDDVPLLSVADATVTEGEAAVVEIQLSEVFDEDVTVSWTTADGSASDADYTPSSGDVTIGAGATSATVEVGTTEDSRSELGETFTVELSTPMNATIDDGSAEVTIVDDDIPAISVADATVEEGGTATLDVSLSEAHAKGVSVDYATVTGTADDNDFTSTSGTLTIPAGETTAAIEVEITQDDLNEGGETFTVELSNPSNATLDDGTAAVTILDDDAPTLSIQTSEGFDYVRVEEGETAQVVVSMQGTSSRDVSFSWAATEDIADEADFTIGSGTATIPAGQVSTTIEVATTEDAIVETEEKFSFAISDPVAATILRGSMDVLITNDDAAQLTVDDVSVTEGDTATITFSLDQATTRDTEVLWTTKETSDGGVAATATADIDYAKVINGSAFIPAGETSVTQQVETAQDGDVEVDEVLYVGVTAAEGVTLADPEAAVTIVDDDVALFVTDSSVDEGQVATVEVSLSETQVDPVTVDYATVTGTADETDYAPVSGTLTFPAGETVATVEIAVGQDAIVEADETFSVELSNSANATISNRRGEVTIVDDDVPGVSVADASVEEGQAASVKVSLSDAAFKDVTVDFTTVVGAADETDFTATSGTITIPAGERSRTIDVQTLDDAAIEDAETFTVELSSPTNATIEDGSGTVTIVSGDMVALSIQASEGVDWVRVQEGENAQVEVRLDQTTNTDVAFTWEASTDTAGEGDFTFGTGTATIPAGERTTTIEVPTTEDAAVEPDEKFLFSISHPVNAQIARGSMDVFITNDDVAQLTVDDVSVAEGDAATVTFNLDQPTVTDIEVFWITKDSSDDGTASTAGRDVDYTDVSAGRVVIPAGETTVTQQVQALQDSSPEDDEVFYVGVNRVEGVERSDPEGAVTIVDDDDQTVSIGDAIVQEGDSASAEVTLSRAIADDVAVDFVTTAGSADETDFTATSGTLTIPAGETTGTIEVQTDEDSAVEDLETFSVDLTTPLNVTIDDGTGDISIQDDDFAEMTVADAIVDEGETASVHVELSGISTQDVTVDWATVAMTADEEDFESSAGTLTIPAGRASASVEVATTEDQAVEDDETLRMIVSNPTGATIVDDRGIVTIADDDVPTVNFRDPTREVTEGGSVLANVELSDPYRYDVQVDWTLVPGTASSQDFTAGSGTVTIPSGETLGEIEVQTTQDTGVENDEELTVKLSEARSTSGNLTITADTATVTIADDDLPTITVEDATVAEGESAKVRFLLSDAASADISVDWTAFIATADTASGSDFTADSGVAQIAAGSMSTAVEVQTTPDTSIEADETFSMEITASGATVDGSGVATVTILDDDVPAVSVSDAGGLEGDTAYVELGLDQASDEDVDVTWTTSTTDADGVAGSATADADFTPSSGTVTISAGATSLIDGIAVPILADSDVEADETFFVKLTASTNSTREDSWATVTIADDNIPTVSVSDASVAEGDEATVTFESSHAYAHDILVYAQTSDVGPGGATATASAEIDYGTIPLDTVTATIEAGETSATAAFSSYEDAEQEGSESFFVEVGFVASGSRWGHATESFGKVTILDDDVLPTVTVSDVSTGEGDEAVVEFELSDAFASPLQINWQTANFNPLGTASTATKDVDYTSDSDALSIPAGDTSAEIAVTTLEDGAEEGNENFFINVNYVGGGGLSGYTTQPFGKVTILDDDLLPTVTVNDVSVVEGAEATVRLELSETYTGDIQITYQTSNLNPLGTASTATKDVDYTSRPHTSVTIPAGETSTEITVPTTDDVSYEGDEFFFVNVNARNGGSAGTPQPYGKVTILDDEEFPTLTVADVAAAEGGDATIRFEASSAPVSDLAITWSTSATSPPGATATATAGDDYTARSGVVTTIPAGETFAEATVALGQDATMEGSESFFVNVSALNGDSGPAWTTQPYGTVTILDDDELPTVEIDDVSVTEGADARVRFELSDAFASAVQINWQTANFSPQGTAATATRAVDYTSASGQVTISAGETSAEVTVSTLQDEAVEGGEFFFVNVNGVQGGGLSGWTTQPYGRVSIAEDDVVFEAPTDFSITEGGSAATVYVTLDAATTGTRSVTYTATTSGSGFTTADTTDFSVSPTTGTLTFAPGTTTASITVAAPNDNQIEQDEQFVIRLSDPSGGEIGDDEVVVTIDDDESQESLTATKVSLAEASTSVWNVKVTQTGQPTTQTKKLAYTTVDGSATAGSDYVATHGDLPLKWSSCSITCTLTGKIALTITDDTTPEDDETFTVSFANGMTSTITIENDDFATATIEVTKGYEWDGSQWLAQDDLEGTILDDDGNISEADQHANVTVTLSHALDEDVAIPYAISTPTSGDVIESDDLASTSGSVTIDAGDTEGVGFIYYRSDVDHEGDEWFKVTLDPDAALITATGSTLAATRQIKNDDAAEPSDVSTIDDWNESPVNDCPQLSEADEDADIDDPDTWDYDSQRWVTDENADGEQVKIACEFVPVYERTYVEDMGRTTPTIFNCEAPSSTEGGTVTYSATAEVSQDTTVSQSSGTGGTESSSWSAGWGGSNQPGWIPLAGGDFSVSGGTTLGWEHSEDYEVSETTGATRGNWLFVDPGEYGWSEFRADRVKASGFWAIAVYDDGDYQRSYYPSYGATDVVIDSAELTPSGFGDGVAVSKTFDCDDYDGPYANYVTQHDLPALSIDDVFVATDGGSKTVELTVSADIDIPSNVTVDWSTSATSQVSSIDPAEGYSSGGGDLSDANFLEDSGTLELEADTDDEADETATIEVVVGPDTHDAGLSPIEAVEQFSVMLSNPSNAVLLDDAGTVTIAGNMSAVDKDHPDYDSLPPTWDWGSVDDISADRDDYLENHIGGEESDPDTHCNDMDSLFADEWQRSDDSLNEWDSVAYPEYFWGPLDEDGNPRYTSENNYTGERVNSDDGGWADALADTWGTKARFSEGFIDDQDSDEIYLVCNTTMIGATDETVGAPDVLGRLDGSGGNGTLTAGNSSSVSSSITVTDSTSSSTTINSTSAGLTGLGLSVSRATAETSEAFTSTSTGFTTSSSMGSDTWFDVYKDTCGELTWAPIIQRQGGYMTELFLDIDVRSNGAVYPNAWSGDYGDYEYGDMSIVTESPILMSGYGNYELTKYNNGDTTETTDDLSIADGIIVARSWDETNGSCSFPNS